MPKTILITGCSTGFGRATALHLAKHGWQVFATVRKESDRASLFEAAHAQGCKERLAVFLCDIVQEEQVEELAQMVAALTPRLDALLNNAGTAYPGPLELLPLADLRAQLEVNLIAQLSVTQAFLPLLKRARGTIINVSSVGGRIAFPLNGSYHISKFGLEAMSDALRLELAPFGVKVVLVEPGSSATAIWETGLQRGDVLLEKVDAQAYAPLTAAMQQWSRRSAATGFPPQAFADLALKILNRRRPHARYAIPRQVGWMIAARKLMPDWLWDWSLRRALRW